MDNEFAEKRDMNWHCSKTRKCGLVGKESDLARVKSNRFKGIPATDGICPKCANRTFYLRPADAQECKALKPDESRRTK